VAARLPILINDTTSHNTNAPFIRILLRFRLLVLHCLIACTVWIIICDTPHVALLNMHLIVPILCVNCCRHPNEPSHRISCERELDYEIHLVNIVAILLNYADGEIARFLNFSCII